MDRVITTERVPIKVWADDLEEGALKQARNLANLPLVFKHIALMPDSHQGYGMPIGGVLATDGIVVPNAVGVDIGCGVRAVGTWLQDIQLGTLKKVTARIRAVIPVGFQHHSTPMEADIFRQAPDIPVIQRELESARYQIGTLGGGNHFIEIQRAMEGGIWLMLHSGSRNFGLKVAKEYHSKAVWFCEKLGVRLPDKELAFLLTDTAPGQEYLEAMNYCLTFARASRAMMMERVADIVHEETGAEIAATYDVHHNYAVVEEHFGQEVLIHRKGAIRAGAGEIGIIPGSMGSASYIVQGAGNPLSFCSSSHGAGRRMGRKEAIRSLSLADEQRKMAGILGGPVSEKDLDEAPGAYKDIEQVMGRQADLVTPLVRLMPLVSLKG